MTHSDHPESIAAENDRALQSIMRVIRFVSRRRFSLVLVRCNYARLREEMLERLRQDCPVAFQVLRLAVNEERLYTKIHPYRRGAPTCALKSRRAPVMICASKTQSTHLIRVNQITGLHYGMTIAHLSRFFASLRMT